ncbi:MAG: hypothetical protein CR967_02310 [Proteobacteria bacterium]|nr:MAG: hypothetical protein CR967_02310 [Pseudomonadota bacterium]
MPPLQVGVYENGSLIDLKTSEDKTSEALPKIMDELLDEFDCEGLYFVRGPGSFMAIKVSYIFLKTLCIGLDIPLLACDGFEVNVNSPIPAFGKMYFVKSKDGIETMKIENANISNAVLPNRLDSVNFTKDTEPLYVLPAI